MADIALLSSNITSSLDLGDHLYPHVRAIVEGKLRDRVKLVGKKTRKDGVITEESISSTIQYVMTGLLRDGSFDLIGDTADYYRQKYSLAI